MTKFGKSRQQYALAVELLLSCGIWLPENAACIRNHIQRLPHHKPSSSRSTFSLTPKTKSALSQFHSDDKYQHRKQLDVRWVLENLYIDEIFRFSWSWKFYSWKRFESISIGYRYRVYTAYYTHTYQKFRILQR